MKFPTLLLALLTLAAPLAGRAETAPEKPAAPQLDDAKREKIAAGLDKAAAELKESAPLLREVATLNEKLAEIRTKQAAALRAKDKDTGEALQKEAAELREKRRELMEKIRQSAGEVRDSFDGPRRGKPGERPQRPEGRRGKPGDAPKGEPKSEN